MIAARMTERSWSEAEKDYVRDLIVLGYSVEQIAKATRRDNRIIATEFRDELILRG